jgi:REP element-mobilizing transposase RayT
MADRSHAGRPESLVQGAVPLRFGEVQIRSRGRLPHWEKEEGLYFITFHLADSLPTEVVQGIVERQRILHAAKQTGAYLLPSQEVLIAKYSPKEIEAYFDRGAGECVFKDPRIAEAMASALRFWHGKRYRLVTWCIMPNHVHVICRLLPGQKLPDVMKSWKVYSAREANRILGRSGALWQREYYDRLIRREGELDRAVQYVLRNPERAGLKDWKWMWSEGQEALSTAGQEIGAT